MITAYPDFERREVLPFLPVGALRVLDVGCASGGFGRALGDRESYGIEPNADAAVLAKPFYRKVYRGVFPDDVPAGETFDCIVFNDVLEHFVDPYSAVRACLDRLRPDGRVVASIPNMRHMRVIKNLLVRADWTYQDAGILDRTHLRWFTYKTMRSLFEDNGFVVEQVAPINVETSWKAKVLRRIPPLADMVAEQFVVVARPA